MIPKNAEVLLKQMRETQPKKPRDLQFVMRKEPIIELPPPDADINLLTMRPVEPEVREILYHGISRVGEGRYKYLKARNSKSPMEKYWFPECGNWLYGWLGDTNDPCLKDQRFGVRTSMTQSRNGLLETQEIIQPLGISVNCEQL